MVSIEVAYRGQLRCEATHGPSHATVLTDAPVDNHGKGESFSPTDLVATALGTCMMTIMGIVAERHEIDLNGATLSVHKQMVTEPVRRIGRLTVEVKVPADLPDKSRRLLETAAMTCPVHKSLHADIETPITFSYGVGTSPA